MIELKQSEVNDKYSWWCRTCKTRQSIRYGSFFSRSKVELQKWVLIIFFWSRETPVGNATELVGISERVAIDIY